MGSSAPKHIHTYQWKRKKFGRREHHQSSIKVNYVIFSMVPFLYKCGFAVIFRIFQCLYVSVASPCRSISPRSPIGILGSDIQNISMFVCKCGFAVIFTTQCILGESLFNHWIFGGLFTNFRGSF